MGHRSPPQAQRAGWVTWYEIGIVASAVPVAIPVAVAMWQTQEEWHAFDLRLISIFVSIIVFAAFPPFREATRRSRKGRDWRNLREPYRAAFRRLLLQHVALCFVFTFIMGVPIALHFIAGLDTRAMLILFGLMLALLLTISWRIKRRLHAVWIQSGALRVPLEESIESR
jgi:hypothetical protein